MFRKFLFVTMVAGCATSTLYQMHKQVFFVSNPKGDAPPGTYEMTCNEYETKNDPTAHIDRILGAPTKSNYYSARCTVQIEGRTRQCFFDNYDVDPFNSSFLASSCAAFVENWKRPVESDNDGGYSPP